ncbi:hypothetical protein BH10PLA2_BH10PLA2_34300 [soil metagenome]
MSTILSKGVIRNGMIELPAPIALPDGTEVLIATTATHLEDTQPSSLDESVNRQEFLDRMKSVNFMTEEEQGDDTASIQAWLTELRSIPPVPTSPEQQAALQAWRAQMRESNLEAVRKQFEQGLL